MFTGYNSICISQRKKSFTLPCLVEWPSQQQWLIDLFNIFKEPCNVTMKEHQKSSILHCWSYVLYMMSQLIPDTSKFIADHWQTHLSLYKNFTRASLALLSYLMYSSQQHPSGNCCLHASSFCIVVLVSLCALIWSWPFIILDFSLHILFQWFTWMIRHRYFNSIILGLAYLVLKFHFLVNF